MQERYGNCTHHSTAPKPTYVLTFTLGEKKDPATKKCVPDTDDADRKGHCPDGQVLNEREGPSNVKGDIQSCRLNDEKNCKEPNIPESRKEGDELKQEVKVGCGRDKDGKIREAPKCNKKKEWRKSFVDSEGNAVVECVPTTRFKERLKNRLNKPDFVKSVKDFHNKMADKFKNQREVGDKALKDSKEEKAKRQKQVDEDAKKEKAEMDKKEKAKLQKSKCEAGQLLFAGALEQNKRDKKGKRDAAEDENDSYAKTTLWFEEPYLTHDDRLKELPKDLDLSKVADDVDFDAYIKVWAKYIDDQKPLYTGGCNYSKRSSLSARCSQRRSVDEDDDDTDPDDELDWLDAHPYNTSTLVQRDFGPGDEPAMTTGDYEERLKALESRNLSEIEKRQAQIVLAWLIRLGLWASNAGLRLSQAAATISNSAPRLWAIMGKHGSKFLFQPAKATQGAKGGGAVMEKTSKGLWDKWGRELTKCMLEGLPSAFL
jgi:hypothetical protein